MNGKQVSNGSLRIQKTWKRNQSRHGALKYDFVAGAPGSRPESLFWSLLICTRTGFYEPVSSITYYVCRSLVHLPNRAMPMKKIPKYPEHTGHSPSLPSAFWSWSLGRPFSLPRVHGSCQPQQQEGLWAAPHGRCTVLLPLLPVVSEAMPPLFSPFSFVSQKCHFLEIKCPRNHLLYLFPYKSKSFTWMCDNRSHPSSTMQSQYHGPRRDWGIGQCIQQEAPRDTIKQLRLNSVEVTNHLQTTVASNDDVLLPTWLRVLHKLETQPNGGSFTRNTAGLTAERRQHRLPCTALVYTLQLHRAASPHFSLDRARHLATPEFIKVRYIILLQEGISTCQRPGLGSMGRVYSPLAGRARAESEWRHGLSQGAWVFTHSWSPHCLDHHYYHFVLSLHP